MSAAALDGVTWVVDCGRMDYGPAHTLQERLHAVRVAGKVPDTILLVEHNPVYTLGRHADESNILMDRQSLAARGIEIHRVGRGGQVTYHGPGQLVGYPIVSLRKMGAVGYVSLLERVLIETLAVFGIEARTDDINRGVWVGQEKIAAIGVRISRGVAMHGFALNVDPRMSDYAGIVPCGIASRGVTSMALQGFHAPLDDVKEALATRLVGALGGRPSTVGVAELQGTLDEVER